jgi:hypothetical protein
MREVRWTRAHLPPRIVLIRLCTAGEQQLYDFQMRRLFVEAIRIHHSHDQWRAVCRVPSLRMRVKDNVAVSVQEMGRADYTCKSAWDLMSSSAQSKLP